MKLEEFIGLLNGVRSTGEGSYVACCPAHGDEHPSMSVTSKDGKILVHCHANCTAADIVGAMGLELKDLFEDRARGASDRLEGSSVAPSDGGAAERAALGAKPKKTSGSHGKWICDYLYHDTDGTVLYKASRYLLPSGKKSFCIKHRDDSAPGGWAYGLKDAGLPRVVYHLPDVIAAAKAGRMVVIAEGEKDVDNLRALGFVATCNVGGAGKWGYCFPNDWGSWFKGVRAVLIIADNDPETKVVRKKVRGKDEYTEERKPFLVGQKHAWDVRRQLLAAGFDGDIKMMVMPSVGEARPKDFTDWMDAAKAAGVTDVKAAFKSAVASAVEAGWPDAWQFTDEACAQIEDVPKDGPAPVAPAEKGGRDALLETPDADGMGDAGRFGRLVPPRTPLENVRIYEVDLRIDRQRRARFKIGVDHFQFEPWRSGDGGKTFQCSGAWNVMHGPLSNYVGMAEGCLFSFCDNDRKAYKYLICDLTCKIVVAWLRARGRFFADLDNPCYESSMYFNDECGMLYDLHGAEFKSYLATEANINRNVKTFDLVMSVIDDLALNPKETTRVVPSRQWERKGKSVYLSSGDSEMYRIADGRIDLVPNGTDGVLFLRGFTFEPWKLQSGAGLDPFANAIAFKTAAWSDCNSLMNIRLWYLNLFACHKNKPLLLIEGPAGSGKTTIARLLKGILAMRARGKPDTSVNVVKNTDKAAEDFWVIVHNGRLEVFDNLDQKIKWANNELQTVSTGGSQKGRRLYATDDVYILYPNSYLILTSNNPIFATEGGGLPDRIIQAHIGLGRNESLDNELTNDIAKHRNEFLTWTARTLAAALADDKPVDRSVNKRHPDYGVFSVKCSRAIGCEQEAIRAMGAAEIDKAVLPLMNETVAKEIYSVLLHQVPIGSMKFTAGEMSDVIIKRIGDENADDRTRTIYGSRRIGKALSAFRKEFGVIFRMRQPRMLDGKTLYEFDGLTPQGQAIVMANESGSVGFEEQKSKTSYIEAGADTLFKSNPLNPLNQLDAPYARAGEQDIHFLSKENESIVNDGDDEVGDGTEGDDDLYW